jgi:hypothetical protein
MQQIINLKGNMRVFCRVKNLNPISSKPSCSPSKDSFYKTDENIETTISFPQKQFQNKLKNLIHQTIEFINPK